MLRVASHRASMGLPLDISAFPTSHMGNVPCGPLQMTCLLSIHSLLPPASRRVMAQWQGTCTTCRTSQVQYPGSSHRAGRCPVSSSYLTHWLQGWDIDMHCIINSHLHNLRSPGYGSMHQYSLTGICWPLCEQEADLLWLIQQGSSDLLHWFNK